MKLWIVSDIHANSLPWIPNYVPAHDLLVIAGDISDGLDNAMRELRVLHRCTGRAILFVPGNHDVFDGLLDGFRHETIMPSAPKVTPVFVLPAGESVVYGGVRFIGATLWTDWALGDKEWAAQAWAARHMPEYARVARSGGDLIWPIDTSNEHDRHRHAIEQALKRPHDGPTVVVTHHAPSARSLHAGEARGEEAGAFASDLEDLMTRYRAQLWVHGHIHTARDYHVGGTRVICNPRGYEQLGWYEKTGWQEDLVIEV